MFCKKNVLEIKIGKGSSISKRSFIKGPWYTKD
jgi:hypothetical protein